MAGLRIRGQEVTMRVAVDGQIQAGSFFKVTDFEVTPRSDLVEESFLGEPEDDIDFQHHGFDLKWSIHNSDARALELLSTLVQRNQDRQAPPDVTITVIYAFRDEATRNQVEVYHDVLLRITSTGFTGRKDYVVTGFEAKCKRRSLLPA